jgi:hypothetical protein
MFRTPKEIAGLPWLGVVMACFFVFVADPGSGSFLTTFLCSLLALPSFTLQPQLSFGLSCWFSVYGQQLLVSLSSYFSFFLSSILQALWTRPITRFIHKAVPFLLLHTIPRHHTPGFVASSHYELPIAGIFRCQSRPTASYCRRTSTILTRTAGPSMLSAR